MNPPDYSWNNMRLVNLHSSFLSKQICSLSNLLLLIFFFVSSLYRMELMTLINSTRIVVTSAFRLPNAGNFCVSFGGQRYLLHELLTPILPIFSSIFSAPLKFTFHHPAFDTTKVINLPLAIRNAGPATPAAQFPSA